MTPPDEDLLEKYKKQPFAKGLLGFRAAMKSLDSPVPAIYAKQDGRQRWVIYDKNTKQPALFSYAAIFAEGDPELTGNYVPAGEDNPSGIDPKGIQVRPNLKCFYTYIFDSFVDLTLYEGQWALDTYISKLPGFNPAHLPRRSYLSGHEEKYRSRFWMQTSMFVRRAPKEEKTSPPSHLHEWVIRAESESKVFKANPDRPRLWVKDGSKIMPISQRDPGTLQRGDAVAVSFTVTYHLTSVNWFAQFHPADLVVLKSWDGDTTDYGAPSLGLYSRPPPALSGFADDEVMAGENVTDGSATVEGETDTEGSEPGGVGRGDVDQAREGGKLTGEERDSPQDFEMVRLEEGQAGKSEGVVDVVAQEVERRGGRATAAKSGRGGRKGRP